MQNNKYEENINTLKQISINLKNELNETNMHPMKLNDIRLESCMPRVSHRKLRVKLDEEYEQDQDQEQEPEKDYEKEQEIKEDSEILKYSHDS